MAYRKSPFPVNIGGTGATTASVARTNLGAPLNTNTMLLDGSQNMSASLNAGGFKITNGATPSANTDFAIKSYVDSAVGGLDPFLLMGV